MDDMQVRLGQIGGDRESVVSTIPATSPPVNSTPDMEVEPMTATPKRRARPFARPLDIVRAGDGDPRHGSPSTYSNHQCRCDMCKAAQSEYMRDLRRRRREQADTERAS